MTGWMGIVGWMAEWCFLSSFFCFCTALVIVIPLFVPAAQVVQRLRVFRDGHLTVFFKYIARSFLQQF